MIKKVEYLNWIDTERLNKFIVINLAFPQLAKAKTDDMSAIYIHCKTNLF